MNGSARSGQRKVAGHRSEVGTARAGPVHPAARTRRCRRAGLRVSSGPIATVRGCLEPAAAGVLHPSRSSNTRSEPRRPRRTRPGPRLRSALDVGHVPEASEIARGSRRSSGQITDPQRVTTSAQRLSFPAPPAARAHAATAQGGASRPAGKVPPGRERPEAPGGRGPAPITSGPGRPSPGATSEGGGRVRLRDRPQSFHPRPPSCSVPLSRLDRPSHPQPPPPPGRPATSPASASAATRPTRGSASQSSQRVGEAHRCCGVARPGGEAAVPR